MRVRDSLLSLANAVGVTGVVSNQQTSLEKYVNFLNQDLAQLIKEIEPKLGFSLATPTVGAPPVIEIGQNVYNPDTIRHAYVPHRVRQLLDLKTARILEIGGGYGCVARFAFLSGCTDWTIVDLPYVNAIQMLWLGSTIGPEAVSGFDEPDAPIKLRPSTHKDTIKDQRFTLALNMDSLPEIPREEAKAYAKLIMQTSDRLLSINQEAQKTFDGTFHQLSVHELLSETGLKLKSRHPYWMEQGYTEELYEAL